MFLYQNKRNVVYYIALDKQEIYLYNTPNSEMKEASNISCL